MQYELLQRNLDFIKNKYQKVKLIILNETLIWLYIGKYVHQIDTTNSVWSQLFQVTAIGESPFN